MVDDIRIRFGGDTGGIRTAADQAKGAVQSFATTTRGQNAAARQSYDVLKAAIDEANASLRQIQTSTANTSAVASQARAVAVLTAAYRGLRAADEAASDATGRSYAAAGTAISATATAARSGAAALAEYAFNALAGARALDVTALSTQGLTGAIERQRSAFQEWRRGSQIYGSGLLEVEGRAIAVAGNMDRLQAAAQARGFENATRILQSFTLELTKVPGMTDQGAASIETMLASVPNYTGAANASIVSLIAMMASSEDEAKQMASSLTAALRDPAAAGSGYLAALGGVSRELRTQFDLARQSGNANQMQAALLSALVERARAYGNEMTRALQEQLQSFRVLGPLAGLFASRLRGQVDEANRVTDALEKQLATIERRNAALARTPLDAGQLADATAGLLGGTAQAGIDQATGRIDLLRQRLQGATGDAAALIRQFEGFSNAAYRDSDGRFRVGFGSDTTTGADGRVSPVTADTVTTREDAERDLARRVVEFQAGAAAQVGAAWQGLSDRAKASLTSVAYNYGSLPADVAAAGRSGNEGAIADAIRARSGNNGGVNAGRRNQEADNITGGAPAEALRQQLDLRQQLQDRQAGGNALDREALATAQANAAGKRDEVAAQERANDALRHQLDATADLSARTALQTRLAQGEAALAEKRVALTRSEASLQTAEMETGSRERLRILNDALTVEQGLHARGTAAWNQLEAQKVANTRAVEQAEAQERATAEDTAYQNAKRVLEDRMRDIRQEAQERGLTFAERRAETSGVLAQIEDLERDHQRKLTEIWGQGTSQYRQAMAQLDRLSAESASRRAQAEREMQKAEYQDTKRTYEQIGSTLTGNVFSVIQGQTTIAQAARATALSIVQSYVQARVKLIADWLAGVSAHQAGEAAKTAATTAGVAVRTGAEETGAAASFATQAGAMVKSIMASAAETFAGIFGFLSPLLGPAAVGPAAAGEATVAAAAAAIPSFAVGAWSLPTDMIAQVHQGEMIVPAGPAGALRAAMGGSPSPSLALNHTTQINVSAVDGASVADFFQNHSRPLMRAINQAVRQGAHLGLSRIGPG
ncbi:glycoside hydrolase family protein [Methylobacterium brachiatum]|uniref:glycoside hydrolase family protein n=1 Tax=Methylobacterium brachiatum TaxID=269660 RepID=UPI000EFAA8E3|nr:hypothetical protein [Methylobacterium brachiatum]AYO81578.1 hypothetical protein EBB05_04340 [Methylobacterium brachiatum]